MSQVHWHTRVCSSNRKPLYNMKVLMAFNTQCQQLKYQQQSNITDDNDNKQINRKPPFIPCMPIFAYVGAANFW